MKNKDNPKFFEPIQCEKCHDNCAELVKHKYTDEIICVNCLNDLLKESEENDPEENERLEIWEERGFDSSSDYANFITKGA